VIGHDLIVGVWCSVMHARVALRIEFLSASASNRFDFEFEIESVR